MKEIVIRLTPDQARLLAQNIDGLMDAGACEGGLTEAENKALRKAYDQIMKQLQRQKATLCRKSKVS